MLSRRGFFGLLAAAVAVRSVPPAPKVEMRLDATDLSTPSTGAAVAAAWIRAIGARPIDSNG